MPDEIPNATNLTAIRQRVYLIHAACAAVLGVAVLLRYTLLKDVEDAGSILYPVVTIIWGALGFTPPKPVMALTIAALETNKLKEMLSLRPASDGNALSSVPPPAIAVRFEPDDEQLEVPPPIGNTFRRPPR